jgi:DNA-binding response OmpR family regulator
MRILVAEDEEFNRSLLTRALTKWGHEVLEATDGGEAWEKLRSPDPPNLVVLDWIMPVMDGLDLVSKIRGSSTSEDLYTYVIMLTQKGQKEEIIQGLDAGADDYITKPYDPDELRVRIRSGERLINLHSQLRNTNMELQEALDKVKTLSGLLPICSWCKKVRDDKGYWRQIENYIREHSSAEFSHSICPECSRNLSMEVFDE